MNNDQSWNHRPTMAEFMGETKKANTPAQLENAIQEKPDSIIIEGDLAGKIHVEANGKAVSLAVAIGHVVVSIAQLILAAKSGGPTSFTSNEKGKYYVQSASDGRIVLKRI